MKMARHTLVGLATALLLLSTACGQLAGSGADYPSKSITMIVPVPAGSATDGAARALAKSMEAELGQRIIIQNQEGGGGTVGLGKLAKTEADGHTIGWMTSPAMTMQWQLTETPFGGPDTLEPVAEVTENVIALFVRPDSGIDSPEAFVKEARKKPGKMKIGLSDKGSHMDIVVRLFEEAAGIELDKTYFGAGKQVLPVVNGTVDAGVAQPAPVVQYAKRGDLKWAGLFGTRKPAGLDAPLISDSGYELAYDGYRGYEGLVVPKGTPDSVVQELAGAAETATKSKKFQQYIESSYGVIGYRPPKKTDADIRKGVKDAAALIKKYRLKSS